VRRPAERPHIGLLLRGVRYPGYPEPGFCVTRLRRGAVLVPALIWRPCPMLLPEDLPDNPEEWCQATETYPLPLFAGDDACRRIVERIDKPPPTLWQGLRARIGDDEVDPCETWVRGRTDPLVVARQLAPDKAYQYRMARREWAVTYAPAEPEARPRERANLAKLPSLF
jgi:hypothetical protein